MFGHIVFENGVLNHVSGEKHHFEMRLLTRSDMRQMSELRDIVSAGIEEWDMFLPTPDPILEKGLGNQGVTCGTFVDDRLVGLRSLHFSAKGDPENIGVCACVDDNELDKVVDMRLSLVIGEYRRNNLQKRMTTYLLSLIEDMKMKHLCAIVSPKNIASMRDKFILGMRIESMMLKKESYWRCLFHLDRSLPLPTLTAGLYVGNRDFDRQCELIRQGYCGFNMIKGGNNTGQIYYAVHE